MEDEIKYAVYVVLVEDSERTDMALSQFVDSMERVGVDLDYTEASTLMQDLLVDTHG